MVRSSVCNKLNVKRGLYNGEEDAKMLEFVSKNATTNWAALPTKAGLKRCGKSCRLRWNKSLKPDLKRDSFTPEEEELIVKLHAAIGSRWSIIAQQLPGRTDEEVKNYWNTKLRKKLSDMGIDPITHKPFSQILADYCNVGCLRRPGTRAGALSKDFKNAVLFKSESEPILPQGLPIISSYPMQPAILDTAKSVTFNTFLNINSNQSIDPLPLQAIDNQTTSTYTNREGCLSSTPSPLSSTRSASAQQNPIVPFSWHDFLLEDAFPPAAETKVQELMSELLSEDIMSQTENVTQQSETVEEVTSQQYDEGKSKNGVVMTSQDHQNSSFSDFSSVEAMLNQENEMFLHFPELMEEPFFY